MLKDLAVLPDSKAREVGGGVGEERGGSGESRQGGGGRTREGGGEI